MDGLAPNRSGPSQLAPDQYKYPFLNNVCMAQVKSFNCYAKNESFIFYYSENKYRKNGLVSTHSPLHGPIPYNETNKSIPSHHLRCRSIVELVKVIHFFSFTQCKKVGSVAYRINPYRLSLSRQQVGLSGREIHVSFRIGGTVTLALLHMILLLVFALLLFSRLY